MSDASEYQISMAGGDGEGEDLNKAIQTRRRRKCIAQGVHQAQPPDTPPTACPRCGL